ncbi:hypothetical protein LZ30DRAFT_731616 [Colletotrichum cereale]|nr:hypothetical protein LZ30DRAFT_731616 [Colletotrichum cereale]
MARVGLVVDGDRAGWCSWISENALRCSKMAPVDLIRVMPQMAVADTGSSLGQHHQATPHRNSAFDLAFVQTLLAYNFEHRGPGYAATDSIVGGDKVYPTSNWVERDLGRLTWTTITSRRTTGSRVLGFSSNPPRPRLHKCVLSRHRAFKTAISVRGCDIDRASYGMGILLGLRSSDAGL